MKHIIFITIGLFLTLNVFSQSKIYRDGYVCENTNGMWGTWKSGLDLACKVIYNSKKFPVAIEIESQGEQFYIKLKDKYLKESKGKYFAEIDKYRYTKGYSSVNSKWVDVFKVSPVFVSVSKIKSQFYIYLTWGDEAGFGFGFRN